MLRLPIFPSILLVAGLSALMATYALQSGNTITRSISDPHDQELAQELDQLRTSMNSLTTGITRLDSKLDKLAATQAAGASRHHRADDAQPALTVLDYSSDSITPLAEGASTTGIGGSPKIPKIIMVDPTPEQNEAFERLKERFNDPSFVKTLNLAELNKMDEMKSLPGPLQQVILGKAFEKLNRGEVDENTFLSGMAGHQ